MSKPSTRGFLLQRSAEERRARANVDSEVVTGSRTQQVEGDTTLVLEVGGRSLYNDEPDKKEVTNETVDEAARTGTVPESSLPSYQGAEDLLIEANADAPLESSTFEHQPLAAMGDLSAERFSVSLEDQGNQPWDASNSAARKLSPFTIQLLPPDDIVLSESSGNADPYSWDKFSSLVKDKIPLKSSNKIEDQARAGISGQLDQAISSLSMLMYDGQVSAASTELLSGRVQFDATPLFSVANVADVYMQLLTMFKTPPLVLLINPNSMSVNYNKIQNFSERTRYGYIYQAWGEELPVLNFSGRIGAYVGGESANQKRATYEDAVIKNQKTTHVSGVQEVSRRVSPAYQNLMQLLLLYKNNAYIRDNVGGSQANHMIGTVEISYDGVRYQGQFDKMEWSFEENNNLGGVNFSFDFTATRIVHTDERNSIPMKQRDPNSGQRFGDDRNDGRSRTMRDYMTRLANAPDDGSSFGIDYIVSGQQNIATVDEDGNLSGGAVRSWREQATQDVLGLSIDASVNSEDYEDYENPSGDTNGIVRSRNYTPEDF